MTLGAGQRALGTLERVWRLAQLAAVLEALVAEGVPAESQQTRLVLARRRVCAVARRTAQHTALKKSESEGMRLMVHMYNNDTCGLLRCRIVLVLTLSHLTCRCCSTSEQGKSLEREPHNNPEISGPRNTKPREMCALTNSNCTSNCEKSTFSRGR